MRNNCTTSLVVKDVITGTWADDVVSETRYAPWGETRFSSGISLTNYKYTGQYSHVDDFGGGEISSALMGMITELFGMNDGSLQTEGLDSGTGPDSYDMQVEEASIFWQGIPRGSGKQAVVTFTHANKTGAWQKPPSTGIWGEDVLEVLTNLASYRIIYNMCILSDMK